MYLFFEEVLRITKYLLRCVYGAIWLIIVTPLTILIAFILLLYIVYRKLV